MMEEFYQLKEEIFNCNKIENAFIFTKELVAGCKKRPFIKKLFWKVSYPSHKKIFLAMLSHEAFCISLCIVIKNTRTYY